MSELSDEVNDVTIELPSNPLFIQFDSLRKEEGVASGQAITIHRPSILKVILLQSQASTSPSHTNRMNTISLSGVVLHLKNDKWLLHDGYEFHDPACVEEDKESKMERYPLPGGIVAVYNHTKNCWFVLPPPEASLASSSINSSHLHASTEYNP